MGEAKRGRPSGKAKGIPPCPEIFRFHDYREYLKDWVKYRKATQAKFSLRRLAKEAGVASGFLPMVLSAQRELSEHTSGKLAAAMELGDSETSFFKLLVRLGSTSRPEERVQALDEMKRFVAYQKLNRPELEVHQYLSHWYYVAIREMAVLPGFQATSEWIQPRLQYKVTLQEIQTALDFLLRYGFLSKAPDGSIQPPDKPLECNSGVYRIALGQFHREMLNLATESIERSTFDERSLLGHTVALTASEFQEVRKVIEETITRIKEASSVSTRADRVYQCELALFPLTRPLTEKEQ